MSCKINSKEDAVEIALNMPKNLKPELKLYKLIKQQS